MKYAKSIFATAVTVSLLMISGCGNSHSSKNGNESSGTSPMAEPYAKYLWHLESANSVFNEMGFPIDPHADVNGAEAMQITQGDNVIVAVIDVGVDIDHEDLRTNIIDTYNAVTQSHDGINPHFPDSSHGTVVAGFIAAPVNGIGITGIAPRSKLIIIQFSLEASDSELIRAFEYAKKSGARVINNSWGSAGHLSDALAAEIKSLYDAGITIVFAAGNDGQSQDRPGFNDESELPWVISVGATGENNDVTAYSSYGSALDILAPGGESLGLLGLDDMGDAGADYAQYGLVNDNYAFHAGTSISAPITTGTIALMYAVNPSLTPKQVRDILISTATKVGGNEASYNSAGFDIRRGYGKLNAYEAVRKAQSLLTK